MGIERAVASSATTILESLKSARDRDALLLAAGKLVPPMINALAEAELGQVSAHP